MRSFFAGQTDVSGGKIALLAALSDVIFEMSTNGLLCCGMSSMGFGACLSTGLHVEVFLLLT